MWKKKHVLYFISILMLVACTLNDSPAPVSPTLSLSEIRTILPTVSPAELEAYAQIADEATLVDGQELYEAHCASCHGINGEGQFPDAPLQADSTGRIGAPPHNADGHTWHHHDDLLYEIIRFGGQGNPEMFYTMPAFGNQLSDDNIEAILAYIKTMWTDEQRLTQAERTLTNRSQNP